MRNLNDIKHLLNDIIDSSFKIDEEIIKEIRKILNDQEKNDDSKNFKLATKLLIEKTEHIFNYRKKFGDLNEFNRRLERKIEKFIKNNDIFHDYKKTLEIKDNHYILIEKSLKDIIIYDKRKERTEHWRTGEEYKNNAHYNEIKNSTKIFVNNDLYVGIIYNEKIKKVKFSYIVKNFSFNNTNNKDIKYSDDYNIEDFEEKLVKFIKKLKTENLLKIEQEKKYEPDFSL